MALGARRKDLDYQEGILDRLAPRLVALAGCRDVGLEIGIRTVSPDQPGFDLRIASIRDPNLMARMR